MYTNVSILEQKLNFPTFLSGRTMSPRKKYPLQARKSFHQKLNQTDQTLEQYISIVYVSLCIK